MLVVTLEREQHPNGDGKPTGTALLLVQIFLARSLPRVGLEGPIATSQIAVDCNLAASKMLYNRREQEREETVSPFVKR